MTKAYYSKYWVRKLVETPEKKEGKREGIMVNKPQDKAGFDRKGNSLHSID